MRTGWIKIHRKILDNPVVTKDADHLAVWVWLLCEAAYEPHQRMFGKKKVTLQPGQLITSAYFIADELDISESKVRRILKAFKSDAQIDARTERYGRLITVLSWDKYQLDDAQDDGRVTHERRTSDARVTQTKEYKEIKKDKKIKNNYIVESREIISYLNEMCGTSYKPTSKKTQELIEARINEGFTVDDFKTVIYKKGKQWMDDPKMCKFIRPETLFSNKFEGYLNEKETRRYKSVMEVDF